MIRSMQNAKPKMSTKATNDMKPALPSMNLVFKNWCTPLFSVAMPMLSVMVAISSFIAACMALSFCATDIESAWLGCWADKAMV